MTGLKQTLAQVAIGGIFQMTYYQLLKDNNSEHQFITVDISLLIELMRHVLDCTAE